MLALGAMLAAMGFLWQERAFPPEKLAGAGQVEPPASPVGAAISPATTPGTAAKPGGAAAGGIAAGQAVFQQNCNGCHPSGNKGAGPQLKGGNIPPERVQQMVRTGGAVMPAFPATQISDQQLADLVAYVQSLK